MLGTIDSNEQNGKLGQSIVESSKKLSKSRYFIQWNVDERNWLIFGHTRKKIGLLPLTPLALINLILTLCSDRLWQMRMPALDVIPEGTMRPC